MAELIRYGETALTQFNPAQTREKIAHLDGDIVTFRKLKEWPALRAAVDEKVEEQKKFVARWKGTVHRKGGERWIDNANGHYQEMSVTEAEAEWGIAQPTVSRWDAWTSPENIDAYRERIILGAHRKALLEPEVNRHSVETGENEWFTPAQYIEAARQVMGGIDLDPATHAIAQRTVKAAVCYTAADNGLVQPWHGRVWLNPPYEAGLIDKFVAKLLAEHSGARVTEGVLLTHNNTDTRWFHSAAYQARLLCFTLGRIRFVGRDGELGEAPTQGHTFFYFGPNAASFGHVFGAFGFIR